MKYYVGDIIFIPANPHSPLYPGIKCEVLSIDRFTGRITRMKACDPNPLLGKIGFFKEGDDYVTQEYEICLS